METNLVVLKPIFTEKNLGLQETGKYSFWVKKDATKNQIQSSFESVFGVKPLKVNTVIHKGKLKTDWKKRLPIKKSDQKKAIITVDKNKKIELLNLNLKK